MRRMWGFLLLTGIFALVSLGSAQVVIGPPDDPYVMDTTTPPLGRPLPFDFQAAVTINSVNISQLDCSRFPQMCGYVEMRDSLGNPISHLTTDSFCVYQDSTQINSFTIQELSLAGCRTSICLVFDVSGSMNDQNKIGAAKSAARAFVRKMDIYDRVAIVKFSDCYTVVQSFTSDTALLLSKINTLSANGWTAAFDGIWKGVDLTKTELGSKAVIAFSDGMENRSQYCGGSGTPDGLGDGFADDSVLIVGLALGAGVPIHTISLGTDFDPQYLRKLAFGSNGTYYHAPTGSQIDSIYTTIKTRMCSQYLICYTSPDTVQNGDWHNMIVCRQSPSHVCGPCDTASCQEVAPPVIVRTPATINLESACRHWQTATEICAWVTDLDTPQQDLDVKLFYRSSPSSPFTSVGMTRTDSLYCYTIPAADIPCGADSMQYYITASDGRVTVASPPLAPLSHHGFAVCPNHAPTVNAGTDQTIAQCAIAQICWATGAGDVDGNLQSVQLIEGPGTYTNNQICFTPTQTLDYEFVLKATDSCGLIAQDTVVIHYSLNRSPVANAGRDSTLFVCQAQEICWPAGCTDPDNNLQSCTMISGPGAYDGTSICFTPTAPGNYTFVLKAIDVCGAASQDTAVIHVTFNSAPVCTVPDDTSLFQCTPTQICLPWSGTDVDNNLQSCTKISGPGSLVGNTWCYTPSGDETVAVTIRCVDACGAACESTFHVAFDVNQAPIISLENDTAIFQCSAAEVCLPYVVSDPDAGQTLTTTLISGSATIDPVNSTLCFTPTTAGEYTFIAQVQDSCGGSSRDTLHVTIGFNHAPTANAGTDQTVFQCAPGSICWAASCSDIDGNLSSCELVGSPGTYNGSEICFTPTGSGDYRFILKATDACAATGYDTVDVHVTLNSAPQVTAQADTSLFQCDPQSVCLSYVVGDPDGPAGLVEGMISGYGSIDTANDRVCFTPPSAGDYQFIVGVTDGCGLTDRDTVVAHVTFGLAAQITCPSGTIDKFLCGPDSIIQALTITPPTATVTVSNGIYAGGTVRFMANAAGNYSVRVIASESCGADTCDLTFAVVFNHAPTATAGTDQTVFQCAPGSICWAASCSDIDGNLSSCELAGSPGTYNGSEICFTPTGSGDYRFILKATDACAATGYDTVDVHVTLNSAPQVTAQADTSLFQCDPQSVCLSYVVSDPDGLAGLVEGMISGYGSIDTVNNRICFTPPSAGDYQFIVGVTDGCGLTDRDTAVAHITTGQRAVIDCPPDPIGVSLCAAGQVCQALTITPSGATVAASFGTYAAGELCFQADTSGTYTIRVIASESCGADTCDLVFTVDIGHAAQIDCPGTQSRFICAPEEVCVPLTVMTPEASFTVTPIGHYEAGEVCFPADTSGHYVLKVKATTPCGSDSCEIIADIVINAAPVADNPATPVDTFMCHSTEVCYQFAATDGNGGALTWTKLSGVGAVSGSGLWCFNAAGDGDFDVTAAVADACGAADTVGLTYHVTMNMPPAVTLGPDTSIFLCTGGDHCFTYATADTDDNITLEQLLSPTGTIDTAANQICFAPSTGGTYQFIVRATDACNAFDQDTINITVTLGTSVDVVCPADTAVFLCGPEQVCRPVSVSIPNATVTVTPQGTYSNGSVCFTPTTGGQYTFTVIAASTCGADTCHFAVNVTMNANPVANDPPASVDTFICAAAQICRQFGATDPNGGTLTWSRISGAGTVGPTGQWCFTPTSAGTYSIVATVTDSCQAADTIAMAYVVTMNGSPTVTMGPNVQIFRCDQTPYCFPYQVTDPNGNITSEELIAGSGTIDTAANTVCFIPQAAGAYQFIVKATDACGAVGVDTMVVTVAVNRPPVANAGQDFAVFQCASAQVCFPIVNTDPDGNLASCALVQGTGTITCTQVCFTPPDAGVYMFVVRATDSCGVFDDDTVNVTITGNTAPVCNLPRDTSIFQCAPAQVQLPVSATDTDGNFNRCELVHGSGSVAGGFWTHTPTASETDTVVVKCLDQCGAFCQDTFVVAFRIDRAPVANAGRDTSHFFCASGQALCWPASCTDPDGNLKSCALISSLGTYDPVHQEICFTVPSQELTYGFIMKAVDSCGREGLDTSWVRINLNKPPTITLPSNMNIFVDQPDSVCIGADIMDVDDNLQSYSVTPVGVYQPGVGRICFNADTTGTYMLYVTATDSCGAMTRDSVRVKVDIDECLHVQIQKTHNTLQGHYQPVDIYLNGSGKALGGFDLLIGYDQSVLTPTGVEPGPLFADCKWEYFTYRLGAFGNCGNACPSGMLRIIGLAETNNGAYHPTCDWQGQVGTFTTVIFHVSNDRTYGCQYAPISFYWLDCGDNSFSSERGDTLWVSRRVFDIEGNNITDYSYGFPGRYGVPDSCLAGDWPGKPTPERCIDFTNGGIDIVCPDSIDARGDINLNGVRNEVADAVMLTNYFIAGLSVFGNHVEGSIAASDVNGDGTALSVADLVYLIRIIVGDAEPYAKPLPNSTFAVMARQIDHRAVVTYRSTDNAGAALLIFEVDGTVGEPVIGPGAASMDVQYRLTAGELRVLIYNIGENAIAAGENTLVTIPVEGTIKLRDAEVADYNGRPMKVTIEVVPATYALAQNYPNPFNPTTTLQFSLPVAADWTLTVYNVLGQVVERWKGHDQPGIIKVLWDASPYASGMYFYQLKAGDFVEARKMVLLK